MLKYRQGRLIRVGFMGVVLILLVIAVGLQPQQLWSLASSIRYQALFSEAGGLANGNPVTVSGIKVGTVTDVSLKQGDALVTFNIDGKIPLGSDTTAHIRTGTLLGERVLTLESAGTGTMRPMEVIPVSRTSSPYSLTDAVSDLTKYAADTNTDTLNQSLDTLSTTLDQVAPQLGPTFDGLTRISTAINERNQTLSDLLKNGSEVTEILSKRSQQVNTLIVNASDLLQVLVARRQAIVQLLANTSAVAQQLSGLVHDNEHELAPTLQKLNSVMDVLQKNRDNIAKSTTRLGEIRSHSWRNRCYRTVLQCIHSRICSSQQILQPFFDYAFGFRRGARHRATAGQCRSARGDSVPVQRYSTTRGAVAAMISRNRIAAAIAVVLIGLLAAGGIFAVRQLFFKPKTITAYFTSATAIYPGDDVRVSGVKVGRIAAIEPDGTETKLTLNVDRDVPIPADAKAVIVAQNLIAARYVQLAPRTVGRPDDVVTGP